MYNKKIMTIAMLCILVLNIFGTVPVAQAAPLDNVINTLGASTVPSTDGSSGGSNVISNLFSFLFDKILGPILNIFGGNSVYRNVYGVKPKLTWSY